MAGKNRIEEDRVVRLWKLGAVPCRCSTLSYGIFQGSDAVRVSIFTLSPESRSDSGSYAEGDLQELWFPLDRCEIVATPYVGFQGLMLAHLFHTYDFEDDNSRLLRSVNFTPDVCSRVIREHLCESVVFHMALARLSVHDLKDGTHRLEDEIEWLVLDKSLSLPKEINYGARAEEIARFCTNVERLRNVNARMEELGKEDEQAVLWENIRRRIRQLEAEAQAKAEAEAAAGMSDTEEIRGLIRERIQQLEAGVEAADPAERDAEADETAGKG